MSQEHYSEILLGMKDVIIEKMSENENGVGITISLKRKVCQCPKCKRETNKVHDYRLRYIKHPSIAGRNVQIGYRARRYRCEHCNKRFFETCSFIGKYQRNTYALVMEIMSKLTQRRSLKDIAKDVGTSLSVVMRCLSHMPASKPKQLPQVLSLDEFKGNAEGERFQCILTDPQEKRIFDILKNRRVSDLQSYILSFNNRDEVRHVVMDMNRGYRDIARTFLPNAKIVIDRFHVVRYCTWAMDNVRRRVQKAFQAENRKFFKRAKHLLLSHRCRLNDEDKIEVDRMLGFSEDLYKAYALKESFYDFMAAKNSNDAEKRLKLWFEAYHRLHLAEFKSCYRMLRNWKPYILNAFDVSFSNGFTEGCNNATKALKRVSFGIRNFERFRKRILLIAGAYPNI